jgi:hypothetical protein
LPASLSRISFFEYYEQVMLLAEIELLVKRFS